MPTRSSPLAATAAAVMLLSACSASPETGLQAETTEAATTGAPAALAETFEVDDGRSMYLECEGSGSPRVVFISGQRASAQDWSLVTDGVDDAPVFEQVSQHTWTCAYDRPGTPVGESFSRSDPAPMPTTSEQMVEDLHALLVAAGETGPTVVVAHSVGGLAARLYVAEHSEDIAGLVLIDATSTGLQDFETPEQWEIQRKLLAGDISESLAEYPDIERLDFDASFAQVHAAGPVPEVPLVVVSADQPWGPIVEQQYADGELLPGVPADFGYVLDDVHLKSQAALAALVPGSEHVTDTDSGHNVHQEQPQLVSDAILTVIDEVRAAQ